ncbi:metal ion transporter family [Plasmopara halstedii]|uniref:Magnesium transporter n=1 Tax=Plasmopara halstedii TaxID=4781 RepID=A0A0N7L8J9_PLAHL|nr:metal ion transporter family [Plasmopara halstedii]CEG50083.1 metal ion transporter family [Plasmopara halstedii]|eukprot:XP_024586452.1 metal ion transporter family [Plasmopara halstedii]
MEPSAMETRSPGTDYHRIDLRSTHPTEMSSTSSPGSGSLNRFACQFDPGSKNGRVLVLLFDRNGDSVLKEMSRLDVLRMTLQAALPKEEDPEKVDKSVDVVGPPLRRVGSIGANGRRGSLNLMRGDGGGPDGASYGTVCDVQRVHARDIRRMENAFSVSNEPAIIIRKQAILISADPLRAIVMRDMCLVYVPDGADSLLSILKDQFRQTARENAEDPYEFRALEVLLATLARYFQEDYDKLSPVVFAALDRLVHENLHSHELETLREFKNAMNEFESQVDGVRRLLMDLLDNEEDLRLLYLTKLYENPSLLTDLYSFDSEEAEVLIENYLQDIFSTRTKADLMQHRITNTESLVMLKLDSMRNYLLRVDLVFSLVTISLSAGTLLVGVFGMNLSSGVEDAWGWFWGVATTCLVVFIIITAAGVLFFRQKGVLQI